jgi:hypothetical protein
LSKHPSDARITKNLGSALLVRLNRRFHLFSLLFSSMLQKFIWCISRNSQICRVNIINNTCKSRRTEWKVGLFFLSSKNQHQHKIEPRIKRCALNPDTIPMFCYTKNSRNLTNIFFCGIWKTITDIHTGINYSIYF